MSDDVVALVEALLFAAGAPARIADLSAAAGVEPAAIRVALTGLRARYDGPGSGLTLAEVGGGWQLRSAARFAGPILELRRGKPAKLSRASLEVVALIAYRQPITRHEIEAVRGVDSGGVVRSLLERGLVRVSGRRDEPGRPLEYRTTDAFLELFALKDLGEMPTPKDLDSP